MRDIPSRILWLTPIWAALCVPASATPADTDIGPASAPCAGMAAWPFPADVASYQAVQGLDYLTLTGVRLSDANPVQLELCRTEVFARHALLVAASPSGEVPLPQPPVALFGGSVAERADSTAFVSFSPFGVYGFVRQGDDEFVISSGGAGSGQPAVNFNPRALPPGTILWREWACYADELTPPPGLATRLGPGAAGGPRSAACRLAEIAIETDYEFTASLFAGNTAAATAYVATLMGAASEIYTRDLNTRLEVTFLRLWTDSEDPWTQGDTVNQLFEFRDYWNANMTWVSRSAVHFLSGRPLGGGVAYYPALCWPGYDYGLSANLAGYFPYPLQNNHPQNWDPMVVTHELGHNFGAPHTHDMNPPVDGCGKGDCSVCPNGTIMSYCHLCSGGMTNILLQFHPRSVNEGMLPYLDNDAPCDIRLDPVAIAQQPAAQNATPGEVATFSVVATGATPLTYQWRHNGSNLDDDGHYSGTQTAALTIHPVYPEDAGVYDVVVANTCGPVVSESARLWLRGDLNCDGQVNNLDIDHFVQALFHAAEYQADHDGDPYPPCDILLGDFCTDGVVNNLDINGFVDALF